jgi:hypothetical protein
VAGRTLKGASVADSPSAVSSFEGTDDQLLAAALGWKVTSWKRALEEALRHLPPNLAGRMLLEVGTGPHGLSLLFSRLGCRVVCADRRMDYTRESIAVHQRHGIHCLHFLTDARRLALRPRSFDMVVMKSVLGGIYSQAGREGVMATLGSVREVLRPGGAFIALEQLDGGIATRLGRRIRYPSRRWHYFRIQELDPGTPESLLRGFDAVQLMPVTLLSHNMEEWLPHRHPLVRAATRLDRVLEPLVPANWKHLVAIVATAPAAGMDGAPSASVNSESTATPSAFYARSTRTAMP